MNYELDESKTKYFVIAIIILILLSIFLVVHFNNKSLVSGNEEETKTTKTTTTTTATIIPIEKEDNNSVKKVNKVEEEKNEEDVESEEVVNVIYKSTIDDTNKFIYNYKLTNEIIDSDKIISTKLNVDNDLINKDIKALYDISLYDINMNKKSVTNSLINISIPITNDLLGYDEYKLVYINDNNEITDESFDIIVSDGYIKFTTTHLSKFAIIATKYNSEINEEKIDLTNVTIDIKLNDVTLTDFNNLYVTTTDKVDIIVNGLDKKYKLYYLLKDEKNENTYEEYKNEIFSGLVTPSVYTLFIKLVVENENKVFEVGEFNIYDIVFAYDKSEEIKEDVNVGAIYDENGNESTYVDSTTNKNIVIDNVDNETLEDEETNKDNDTVIEGEDNAENNDLNDETKVDDNSDLNNEINIDEDSNINIETEEVLENKATIKVNGNIYLVEKTDISNLELTGHLIIDTTEDITFKTFENKLLTSNLYTITIKSKEFMLNGIKYTYLYINNDLIIKKVEDDSVIEKENFESLFNGFNINTDKEDLVLETYLN